MLPMTHSDIVRPDVACAATLYIVTSLDFPTRVIEVIAHGYVGEVLPHIVVAIIHLYKVLAVASIDVELFKFFKVAAPFIGL